MSNAAVIYSRLRSAGLTEAGALGMLGNMSCESGLISYRLQGDFGSGYAKSRRYTEQVDSGERDREGFAKDDQGYGLCQWTLAQRKRNLYDFARTRGVSIGDLETQIAFALKELREEFPVLMAKLQSTADLYAATEQICKDFENPAIKNVTDRVKAAKKIRDALGEAVLIGGGQAEAAPAPATKADEPYTPYWPPRMLCLGMQGADVSVLQAVLLARGYTGLNICGICDSATVEAVMDYQAAEQLTADGVAGPLTWGRLLQRG